MLENAANGLVLDLRLTSVRSQHISILPISAQMVVKSATVAGTDGAVQVPC
jgi:hypothetical protein